MGSTRERPATSRGRARRLAPLALALSWIGCSPPDDDSAGPEEQATPTAEVVVRGYLVLADEARTLNPCGESRELGIGPAPELEDAYARLARPGSPIFVEVTAGPLPAAGQAGTLDVHSLRRAAPAEEGFGCAEDVSGFVFRAAGVEPFWHVQVKPDGVTWSTPELPGTPFEAAEPRRAGEGWVYELSSAGPEAVTMRLELQPGPCTDSMVGAIYTWTAHVDMAGDVREGCAWQGALAPGA